MARSCVFCGATPLTKEHVLPQWLRDALGVSQLRVRYIRHTRDTLRHHDGPAFLEQVRVVCATCNNGWMNDLEESVRQFLPTLITGRQVLIEEAEQRALARWSLKTMLMYQYTHNERHRGVIPEPDYTEFYVTRELSRDMTARVAFMNYPPDNSVPLVDTLGQGYADVNKPGRAWINTLKIGCLVVQILRAPHPGEGMRIQPFPNDANFRTIWPATRPVGWPLRFAIPYEHMRALSLPESFELPVLPESS
jgi:hypothetical protein